MKSLKLTNHNSTKCLTRRPLKDKNSVQLLVESSLSYYPYVTLKNCVITINFIKESFRF